MHTGRDNIEKAIVEEIDLNWLRRKALYKSNLMILIGINFHMPTDGIPSSYIAFSILSSTFFAGVHPDRHWVKFLNASVTDRYA